jgi:UDP-2,3-diacylglucosamine pyrophosphatase LpxH
MWNVEELFVLSDLHLAAERDAGLFQSDSELAECLLWILTETQDSVTVLAGDILDFLVLDSGSTKLDFDRLGDRTNSIIDHHAEVFDSLAALARSPRHRLVIMGGNHDPELIFPTVQEAIERRLGSNFASPTVRWLVQGEALRLCVGNAIVLVEHGNVLDPWNRINHSTLQSAFSLASRNLSDVSDYQPPAGSRLVLEVASEMRNSFGWIDYLKPETEAVLPLLWHFSTWKQRKLILNLADDYLSMKSFALVKKIGNARNPERLYRGEKEVENSEKDQAFKEWVRSVSEGERLTLGSNSKDTKLVEKLRSVSAQDSFFEIDQPDESVTDLQPVFDRGADLVIHGHTHAAKAYATAGGFYVNTGTWGRLLRLPMSYEDDAVWTSFLNRLLTNDVESFSRPTLARVQHLQNDLTTANLLEWRPPGPIILAARSFRDRQTAWQTAG